MLSVVMLSSTTRALMRGRRFARRRMSARSWSGADDDEWSLPENWSRALRAELESPEHLSLREFVAAERAAGAVYPPPSDTLNALRCVDLDRVRVVARTRCLGLREIFSLSLTIGPPRTVNV